MLYGEFSPSLDAKGRINFPARLREDLGDTFMITKGLDGCLFVYPMEEWRSLEEKIRALPMSKARSLQLFFFSGACEAQCDKQGRVMIPQPLREYAHLDKEVMVVGASVRVEIWNKESWNQMYESLSPDTVAQAMDELGF